MTQKKSKISITRSFSFLTSAALIAAVMIVSVSAHAAADNVAICDRLAAAAKTWFEKAAARNHGGAFERLGAYAEEGRAGPKDEKVAIEFYKKAADIGSDEAADALRQLRCNFTLKDKDGKVVGNLCYAEN